MNIAGIILAGGLGTRMGHVKKAFMEISGKTILDRLLAVYRPLFPEILISARDRKDYIMYDFPVVEDRFEARSSLTGIHAGLHAMTASHGFMAACDGPFLQAGLVQRLLAEVSPDVDVVVPIKEDGYCEPLCAVYSKRCLPFIEAQLKRGDFRIIEFFDRVKVKEVPVALLRQGDPHQVSFFNVNSPEDLKQAELLAAELGL
ncbi:MULTISPECIES: molybdenum cofactor guanylyltransferase [unclassified Pseudodesulfovibrio]|uniref:molybdenum cofactor guanylyltransferase n=1 Tax=unclassified Pseudodesulfovibrio TaxID=2661612 RepID=UPI000FEB63BA|nr:MULTISPECIES: molybdenum cofactor guanylyltransferase [unclassified Pseudodesulfovibrio]MCJ2165195.1 molybdenum cofactor guanylyltransferase [Pseudodesulfovibrio sp. S3-i]RWU03356.1 molybdenum cofactor guanylyltransferase [Pseudodesulfovibrio sp. S3]